MLDLKEENKQLKEKVEKLTKDLQEYQIRTPLCPVELTMTNVEQHKEDGYQWHSPPFYTHPKGHKMCLLVYAGGNRDGKNTHLSSYLQLMKGEYDDHLSWPLRGKFIIQLLNQDGNGGHTEALPFDARTPDEVSSGNGWRTNWERLGLSHIHPSY